MSANVEAERLEQPFLQYTDRNGDQRVFALAPDLTRASVGRARSSDVVLDWDSHVSRLHAQLERLDDGWAVVDDGLSRNGTFVNGERVSASRRLADGDAIRVGDTTMTFHDRPAIAEARGSGTATPAAPDAPAVAVELSTSQRRVLAALCRPYKGGNRFATPPTDDQIADELFLTEGVVKTHLKVLFAKFGVEELPDDQKRPRVIELALSGGVISDSEL